MACSFGTKGICNKYKGDWSTRQVICGTTELSCCTKAMFDKINSDWDNCSTSETSPLYAMKNSIRNFMDFSYKRVQTFSQNFLIENALEDIPQKDKEALKRISDGEFSDPEYEMWKASNLKCFDYLEQVVKGAMCSICGDDAEKRWYAENGQLKISYNDAIGFSDNCTNYIKQNYSFLRYFEDVEIVLKKVDPSVNISSPVKKLDELFQEGRDFVIRKLAECSIFQDTTMCV